MILQTGDVKPKFESAEVPAPKRPVASKLGEALMFVGVIALSSLAFTTVAIAAPFVIAASALTALLTDRGAARGWRPVIA